MTNLTGRGRGTAVISTVLGIVVVVGATWWATDSSRSGLALPTPSTRAQHTATTPPQPSPSTSQRVRPHHHPRPTPPSAATVRSLATRRIEQIIRRQPAGGVSVAVLNTTTGARYAVGGRSGMWTASAYKLYVLETLLLGRQDAGGTGLSSGEIAQATTMIENSDNTAGYSLFLDAGGNSALDAAAQRFGMTHTVPGETDPTFTKTSAPDCLHLLQNLVGPGPLDSASRAFILNLMRNVEADQRWGVGVVADRGTTFANKNGWLSIDDGNAAGEQDDDLWAVTSLGVLTVHHQQVLMAVLTQHQQSMQAGVELVQRLARSAVPVVAR